MWGKPSKESFKQKEWTTTSHLPIGTWCLYAPMTRTHFEWSVGGLINPKVKVLNMQQWCFTSKRWFDTSSHLLGTFVMLLCNLKWTKTTLRLKFWKVICLWHFWDRSLHKVCSIYIYLCLWENIFIGQSYWLSCCGVWYSSGLDILPFLFKVLGDFVFDKIL